MKAKPILATENSNTEKNKLLGLDHLRAFAITFVIVFHYQFFGHPAWVNTVGSFGWTGVDLFFVLSGFLIAGQLFSGIANGRPVSLGEFFIKRFFRIIPPFLVVVILYYSFPVVHEWGHLPSVWRYLTFTLNFGFDLKKYGTFSHAWSLCVEEQFYLVLPLIFWLFNYFKIGWKAVYLLGALFIAGFVTRLLSWDYLVAPHITADDFGLLWNKYIYYPTYNRLDGLLIGVTIAGLFTFYPKVKEWVSKRSHWIMLAGLVLLAGAYITCTPQDNFYTCVFGYPLIALAYGMMLAAVVSPTNILYRTKSWVTAQIATLSYSIYLTHKMSIHLTQKLLENLVNKNGNLMMLICLVASVGVALLMRYLVEKPALRIRDIVLMRLKLRKSLSKTNHVQSNSLPGEGREGFNKATIE